MEEWAPGATPPGGESPLEGSSEDLANLDKGGDKARHSGEPGVCRGQREGAGEGGGRASEDLANLDKAGAGGDKAGAPLW